METELHQLIEQEFKRLQALWQLEEGERLVALRLIALWLDAFAYGRRHLDPGKEAVAAQCAAEVMKAVVHMRPRGKPQG